MTARIELKRINFSCVHIKLDTFGKYYYNSINYC